ncbi:MAG: HNH endonuclease [Gammaproteobacteria bacterium]|nr:MAG: HNH endonuclease [Gammaproteobacteria bacterium]
MPKVMANRKKEKRLSHRRLTELLEYNPDTGVFLWRDTSRSKRPERVAGRIRDDGYREIRIDGEMYRAGRLAWFYVHGEWPKGVIDHIDGNRLNDKINNLRDVSMKKNIRNMSQIRNGKRVGVSFCKTTGKWRARIRVNEQFIHLGYFPTYELACMAREVAERRFGFVGHRHENL